MLMFWMFKSHNTENADFFLFCHILDLKTYNFRLQQKKTRPWFPESQMFPTMLKPREIHKFTQGKAHPHQTARILDCPLALS